MQLASALKFIKNLRWNADVTSTTASRDREGKANAASGYTDAVINGEITDFDSVDRIFSLCFKIGEILGY